MAALLCCLAFVCGPRRFCPDRASLIPGLVLTISLLCYGGWRLYANPMVTEPSGQDSVDVLYVEGNVDQNQKWVPAFQRQTVDLYLGLTYQGLAQKPDARPLIVWPETAMSLNIACALHQQGFKTLLMDCDLGLANLDVLLGITPEGNLQTALLGEADVSDVLCQIDGEDFAVLPAASGVPELTELQPDARDLLLSRLEPVLHKYDFVFMDIGAGISGTVQTFAAMASVRIVVITPEPTSLTDSYALIKVLNSRYGLRDFMVLVNQATSQAEAKSSFDKLSGACKHFLHIEPVLLGHEQHLRLHSQGTGNAQALLLPAGKPKRRALQAVFDFFKNGGPAQGKLHFFGNQAFVPQAIDAQAVGHVFINGFVERIGLLKHHAHTAAQRNHIRIRTVHILPIQNNFAFNARSGNKIVHAAVGLQAGGIPWP